MENHTAVVFQLSFSSMAAALLPAEDSLNQMLCAPPLRARRAEQPKWRERASVSVAPVGPGDLNAPGCPASAAVLLELLCATHITHLLLEKWTGNPSLTALYRNVATAKGFTSSVLTERFMYMKK